MKYLKEYAFLSWDDLKAEHDENYYDADKEFEKLLTNVLSDTRFTLLELEDSGLSANKFSFKYLINKMETMLGGYEWNPKWGESSFDKYIENCLLSASSVFNIRKWLYGDIDGILILEVFLKLPTESLGKSIDLISDINTLQLLLQSINRLGYKYYLDFNSISANNNEKPVTIKIVIKQPE